MIQVERPGGTGTEITMRSLPIEIPSIADLEMEAAIVENFAPHQGLILVTGPTGSGKSTTQASLNRNLLESGIRDRSEEHTSELQSLMRISYAVFCLKKKTQQL